MDEALADALEAYEVELSGKALEESLKKEQLRLRHDKTRLELDTVKRANCTKQPISKLNTIGFHGKPRVS